MNNLKKKTKKQNTKYGYRPSFLELIFSYLFKFLVKIFFINGDTKVSNIFIQTLSPKTSIIFKNKKLLFKTGHGRLFWRAKSFHSEEKMMVKWLETFKRDDIYLDVGANIGIYSVPAATMCDHVYACELDPLNIGTLKENIYLNRLTNKITIIPFPAISSNKIVKIHFRDLSLGDALQSINRKNRIKYIKTKKEHSSYHLGFSLDYIFEKFKLGMPTKVKIDVDGNEKEVFDGAKEIILNAKEIYYEDSGLKDSEMIINKIRKSNFEIINKEIPSKTNFGCNILFSKKK